MTPSKTLSTPTQIVRKKMTDAEHHQQQLEQQEQEEKITIQHLDLIAYKCLGVAQAVRDLSFMRDPQSFENMKARLIELAIEFETTRKKYDDQK
jgi:hypothetical protein